ncbi:hypothetical protein [Halobacteriovorax sp. RT-1-4]|uniref:hypothetical protein n=1 Tax=unclassified Halobacteriovorax TaxID=2639665 RepID=UPI0039997553
MKKNTEKKLDKLIDEVESTLSSGLKDSFIIDGSIIKISSSPEDVGKQVTECFLTLLGKIFESFLLVNEIDENDPRAVKTRKKLEKLKFDPSDLLKIGETLESAAKLYTKINDEQIVASSDLFQKVFNSQVIEYGQEYETALGFFIDELSNVDIINEMVEKWRSSDFLNQRINALEQALDAHLGEKFLLSTPIFLIHIERYFADIFSDDLNIRNLQKKLKINNYLDRWESTNGLSKSFSEHGFLHYIANDIVGKVPEGEERAYPNRNNILHGEDLDYGTKEFSTRCILILDIIANVDHADLRELIKED